MVYRILLITGLLVSSVFASMKLDELKSFKADFTQEVTNESNKTIEYKGEVFIKNTGKVLWKYKTPIIKNVYLVDNVAIVDEPELEQAIYTSLEKSIDIIKLLKEAEKIDTDLYKSTLYNVNYFITLKDGKIQSLAYQDQLANRIAINFSSIEQNKDISDEIFKFIPPQEYDIIKK